MPRPPPISARLTTSLISATPPDHVCCVEEQLDLLWFLTLHVDTWDDISTSPFTFRQNNIVTSIARQGNRLVVRAPAKRKAELLSLKLQVQQVRRDGERQVDAAHICAHFV